MNIRCKKLHPDAKLPDYAKPGDAGMDLTAVSLEVKSDGRYVYDTGLSFEIPEGYVGLIYPRSSISKMSMALTNSVGVVDSGYRGPVKAVFKTIEGATINTRYTPGDRVCQLVIMPHPIVNFIDVGNGDLSDSERDLGGFGSTGI